MEPHTGHDYGHHQGRYYGRPEQHYIYPSLPYAGIVYRQAAGGETRSVRLRRRRVVRLLLLVLVMGGVLAGLAYWRRWRTMAVSLSAGEREEETDNLAGDIALESLVREMVSRSARSPGMNSSMLKTTTSDAPGNLPAHKLAAPPMSNQVMEASRPDMMVPADTSARDSGAQGETALSSDSPSLAMEMGLEQGKDTTGGNDGLDAPPTTRMSPSQAATQLVHQMKQVGGLGALRQQLEGLLRVASDSPLETLTNQVEELSRQVQAQSKVLDGLRQTLDEHPTVRHCSTLDGGPNKGRVAGQAKHADPRGQQLPRQPAPVLTGPEKGFSRIVTWSTPPISTILCTGMNSTDRVCKFKNLCWDPRRDAFFIFKDVNSIEINVPRNRSYLVDTTGIDGHNKFYFDYNEVHPEGWTNRSVHLVEKLAFLTSRFHALNIMHTFHDDFFGLYALHRMFAPPGEEGDERFPFSRDNHLVFLDGAEDNRYDYVFHFITDNPLQFRARLRRLYGKEANGSPICFRDAVLGNSKVGTWYTYGFGAPQGPIPHKKTSGLFVRNVASYLLHRMYLPLWDESMVQATLQELIRRQAFHKENGKRIRGVPIRNDAFITIFSRKLDRIIVNEAELAAALNDAYGLPVRTVRMEDMHLGQQAAILRSTIITVGLHGSALILSIFLPPGALLIELFPYAVPAENYTPYKTLCRLPGMRLAYRAWTNRKAENNFPHPERAPSAGGIVHLPAAQQERIQSTSAVPPHLCCSDPTWLYRIYQDTKVDPDELLQTIDGALKDGLAQLQVDPKALLAIRPGVVDSVRCIMSLPEGVDPMTTTLTSTTRLLVEVKWELPWNGVVPEKYGVWVHQIYSEFFTERPSVQLPSCTYGSSYDVWVRSYVRDPISPELFRSQYSEKLTCQCVPGVTISRESAKKS